MSKFPIKRIRTLALVGQAGSGKTSLAEALLARAGAIPAAGSVERGSTVCDYTPLEKTFKHSLKLAVASFEAQEHRIHLLDTPGYPDFIGHALPALAAVETAAIVINAQNGIEMMTGRFMQWAAKRGLDRLVIVNRIDAENVDLPGLLEDIQQAFGKECLPLNLPAAGASKVSDCFFAPSGEADFSSVEAAHKKLVEQVVEVDEKLMEPYLEKGEVSPEALHEPLERAMREGHLVPVVFTSAKTGAGIGELLDVIVKLLPNPAEGNPPVYLNEPTDRRRVFRPDRAARSGPACARARLQDRDRSLRRPAGGVSRPPGSNHAGNAALHRRRQEAGQGRTPLRAEGQDAGRGRRGGPGGHLRDRQDRRHPFDHILHDSPGDAHIHARPLELPVAVFGLAVQPKKRGDEQKVSDVLHKLMAEDPVLPPRAQRAGERDGDARHRRDAPQGDAGEDGERSTRWSWTRGRPRSPTARPSRRAPRATAGTRSRPAAPGSSARCSSRSSRCRAARASSSWTR